mgnify:CR=1 FL=1
MLPIAPMLARSSIAFCVSSVGEMDVMIKVLAPSMAWYQNFTFRTLLRLPGVQDIRSTATLSEMKNTHRLPLPRG